MVAGLLTKMAQAGIVLLLAGNPLVATAAANPAQSPAALCPAINTLTGQPDAGHWYSPARHNTDDRVPHQCNTCLDKENRHHAACSVATFVQSDACKDLRCGDQEGEFALYPTDAQQIGVQHDIRYRSPARYKDAINEGCRFIMWALDPVIGVEDVNARTARNYWRLAYMASQSLVQPAFAESELAIAIQPPTDRGQHQLHLHLGTLGNDYRRAIDTLGQKAGITQSIRIGNYDFIAQYTPNGTPGQPYSGANPFDIASKMLPDGEASMPVYGILTAIAKGGEGIFVLAAKKFDRRVLNYRQAHACGLAAQPAAQSQ